MVGSSVGPYEVLEKIGAGGMGEVFLGRDPRLKRKVALKCLSVGDGDRGRRIIHEARAAARLNHPNIAAVYDVLEHEGRPFIVMEYVEGESLRVRLKAGRLPLGEVVSIGRHLASALAAAHAQGVIHRDLKPANVQVTPDGLVKVLDFGVAVVTPGPSPSDQSTTGTGLAIASPQPVGTPAYMSPEQLILGRADERSDIYSLGLILFEMATGRLPYETSDRLGQVIALSADATPRAAAVEPSVPRALSDVIAKALEREPAKRFESATAMERALAGVAESDPRDATAQRRHRTIWAWSLRAAIAGIVLTLGVLSWRPLVERVAGRPAVIANPAILALLPPAIPAGNPTAEQLGTAIASVVARNFRTVPGLIVVSREATASFASERIDLERLQRDTGAGYVLDLTVRAAVPSVDVIAQLRRPGAGVPEWEQVLTGDAVDVEKRLLTDLGDVLAGQGIRPRSAAAQQALTKLPTVDAGALMAYIEGRALLDYNEIAGNTQRAIDLLQQATLKDSQFALAHAGLADALRVRFAAEHDPKFLNRAASEAATALKLDPEESAAHTAFAAVENLSGRRDAAVTALRRALDLQPDNDEAHRLLGQIVAAQGDVDRGIAHIQAAIRLRPTAFIHYHTLGSVLFSASRYAPAVDVYRKAAELRPNNAVAYQMMGTNYHMMGDLPQAIGNYEHAVRLGATATAYTNLSFAYFSAGENEKALTAALAALERDPKKASLQRDLGDIYVKLGRRADARIAYERGIAMSRAALAINARDPFSVILIALCEAGLGSRRDAERHAAEAMALAPANRDVLFRSAKVFASTGNHAAALNALRGAIERGYNKELARHDPQLASLRSSPASRKALALILGTDGS